MNYQRIYNRICQRAKIELEKRIFERKNKLVYYESHHIIPKCMGGRGNVNSWRHENIALLTAKEHYMCHRLLCMIYPNEKKLLYAFHRMIFSKCTNKKENLRHSSRLYDSFRKEHSKAVSGIGNPMFGVKHKQSSKLKMSESKIGKPNHRMKGDLNPSKRLEVRKKISESRIGEKNVMKRSDVIEKAKTSLLETLNKKRINGELKQRVVVCPHCDKKGGICNMIRYHFNKCKKQYNNEY